MRLLAFIPLLALAACHGDHPMADQGPPVTKNFDLRDFDSVELTGSDDVEIRTGADYAIQVRGPQSAIDELKLDVDGKRLSIGRKTKFQFNWGDHRRSEHLSIVVTMPAVHAVALTGSGDIKVDRAEGDFDARIGGSGDLSVGMLSGGKAHLSISGSGSLAAAGAVSALDASVTGSGDIQAEQLKAGSGDVSVTGSGNIRAAVAGPAKVSIVGSGDVYLGKDAQCTVSKTGSGDAHCG